MIKEGSERYITQIASELLCGIHIDSGSKHVRYREQPTNT
jgi:hypothetical protein